jgi:hypothetical protein
MIKFAVVSWQFAVKTMSTCCQLHPFFLVLMLLRENAYSGMGYHAGAWEPG